MPLDREPAAPPAPSTAQIERRRIRMREHTHHTAGLANGFVQANICILPKAWADEFLLYCQRNPKPCPLLSVSDVGDPMLPELGYDIDIRSDVPAYCVFRDGELVEQVHDISHLWRDDLVTFALGCSFSFESALLEARVPLKHIKRGESVSMYATNVETAPAGRFHGKLVVSMRPLTPANAIRAVQVTSRFPRVHGAPGHLGLPALIGVEHLDEPYLGIGTTEVAADELPVFWACGVTPHSAINAARPPFSITHKPGHMLITDLLNASLASF